MSSTAAPRQLESKNIFISYSRADAETATQIKVALERAGLKPWIDSVEIEPGQSALQRISDALSEASYLLALISEHSNISHWANREWMAALANRDIVFVPILLDNSDPAALVRDIVHIDLRQDLSAGIQEIVQFFARETRSRDSGPQRLQQPQPFSGQQQQQQQQQQRQQDYALATATRRQLRLVAGRCIDNGALRSYCFDTEIDFDDLEGASLQERLVSLLHRLDREQSLNHFATWLENERARCVGAQIAVLSKGREWHWPNAVSG
jgi:hypothetical protein